MADKDVIVAALGAQQDELERLLLGIDDGGWARPSPCEGWDIADVVLHLIQTNEMAVGSLEGRFDAVLAELLEGASPRESIDDGAAAMVELGRGDDGPALLERWRTGATHLLELFRAANARDRVTWVAGQLSVHTLATTRLAETWIHSGDVATALGVILPPTTRLEHIARLAWRTLPYAFAQDGRELSGPVAFDLVGPNGEMWVFRTDEPVVTSIQGPASDLCAVAGRRVHPSDTALVGRGPDGPAVLELVRTYA